MKTRIMKALASILLVISSFLMVISCGEKDIDTDLPIITLNGSPLVRLTLGEPYEEMGYRAVDMTDGDISDFVVVDYSLLNIWVEGTYTIAYKVKDRAGNTASLVNREIVVGESFAPVISISGDNPFILSYGESYLDQGASALDVMGEDLSARITSDAATIVDPMKPGTYAVTYIVTDDTGAESSFQRTVVVVFPDTPMIVLAGEGLTNSEPFHFEQIPILAPEFDVNAYLLSKDPGWNAYDAQDGDISYRVVPDYSAIDITTPAAYEVSYSVKDFEGNSSSVVKRYVEVVPDATPPVIYLNGNAVLSIEVDTAIDNWAAYSEFGVNVSDNVTAPGNIVITANSLDLQNALENGAFFPKAEENKNSYFVEYTAVDEAGNSSETLIRTVQIVDTTGPDIQLGEDFEVAYAANKEAIAGPPSLDNSGDPVAAAPKIGGGFADLDSRHVGTYVVTYIATDTRGNTNEVDVNVIVQVPSAPGIVNPTFDSPGENLVGWLWSNVSGIYNGIGWGSWDDKQTGSYSGEGPIVFSDGDNPTVAYVWDSGAGDKVAVIEDSHYVGTSKWIMSYGGNLSQGGIAVFKDVTYRLSGDVMYKFGDADPNPYNQIYVLGTGVTFAQDSGNSSLYSSANTTKGSWGTLTLDFTPEQDGNITIGFRKNSRKDGNSGNGESWFDDASVSVVDYPEIP